MVLVLHCYTLCDHCSLVFVFFVLGFALHKIHAFHSRLFLVDFFFSNKFFFFFLKNEEKGSKLCCALFS